MEVIDRSKEKVYSIDEYMERKISLLSVFSAMGAVAAFTTLVLRKQLAENFTEIPDDFPALAISGVALAWLSTILSARKKFRQRKSDFLAHSLQEYFQNELHIGKKEMPLVIRNILKHIQNLDASRGLEHMPLKEHRGDISFHQDETGLFTIRSYIDRRPASDKDSTNSKRHYVDYIGDGTFQNWKISQSWHEDRHREVPSL